VTLGGALKGVPVGKLRILSYESGRMTLELAALEKAQLRGVIARLRQAGMRTDASQGAMRAGSATVVLTVRSL